MNCAISSGLECGLQHSLIRRQVLENCPFDLSFRNEAEDQLTVIRALARGHTFAYFEEPHVEYRIHGENSSAAACNDSLEKRLRVFLGLVRGFENLPRHVRLSKCCFRALRKRLADEYFWALGYAILWSGGRHKEALSMFRRGLEWWPWNVRRWKTYAICELKCLYYARVGSTLNVAIEWPAETE
jgi:hypothetical protein